MQRGLLWDEAFLFFRTGPETAWKKDFYKYKEEAL